MFLGIEIKKQDIKPKKLKVRFTFKRDKNGIPCIKENKIWVICNEHYNCIDFDVLYDLIKADLVEKV